MRQSDSFHCACPELITMFLAINWSGPKIRQLHPGPAALTYLSENFEADYLKWRAGLRPDEARSWSGVSQELQRQYWLAHDFILYALPSLAFLPSHIKQAGTRGDLPVASAEWATFVSSHDIPELTWLGDLLRGAAANIRVHGPFADLLDEYAQKLRSLESHHQIVSETAQSKFAWLFEDDHGFSQHDGGSQAIRVARAESLAYPFNLVYGHVWDVGMRWLDEMRTARCLACGMPLPIDRRITRRYCPGEACKKRYQRRLKNLGMSR